MPDKTLTDRVTTFEFLLQVAHSVTTDLGRALDIQQSTSSLDAPPVDDRYPPVRIRGQLEYAFHLGLFHCIVLLVVGLEFDKALLALNIGDATHSFEVLNDRCCRALDYIIHQVATLQQTSSPDKPTMLEDVQLLATVNDCLSIEECGLVDNPGSVSTSDRTTAWGNARTLVVELRQQQSLREAARSPSVLSSYTSDTQVSPHRGSVTDKMSIANILET